MYLDEPVLTSLPGFDATHLAQVALFCELQRLQDAVATSWHIKEQISSFIPHYSDWRQNLYISQLQYMLMHSYYVYHSKATVMDDILQ